ncbi:hypothetical protein HK104_007204 [Borealophlyctis nickersoniae]|nr:hypothetical protein HK104_007204 [Borealophlyctis nickersoniae]
MAPATPPALEAESRACETDQLDGSDRDSSSNHGDAIYLPSKSEEDGAQVSAANDTDSIPTHPVEPIGENAVQPSLGTGYEGLQPQTIPLKSAAEGVDDSADPRTDQSLSAENTTASVEVASAAENASNDSAIFDKEKQEPDESFSSGPLNRTKTATHGLDIIPNVLKTKISWKDLAGTANLEKLRALEIERAKIQDRAIGEAPATTIGSSSLEKFEELERERERIRSEGIPEVQDVRPVDLTKFEALEKEREMIRSKGIVDGPETTIGTSKLSKLEELERKRESIQSGKVQDVVDTGFSVNLSKLEELEKQREKIRAQGNQEGTEISMRVNLQRLEELERERERIRLNEGKATDVAPAVDLRKLEELEAERARIRSQNTREAPVNTIGALNLSKFEQLEHERERIRLSQTVNDNTGIVRKTSTNLLKAPGQHLSRTDDSIEQKLTPEEGNSERWEKDPEKMHSPRTPDVITPAPTVALAKLEQLEREREKIRMGASQEAPINTIGALNLSKFESLEREREKLRSQKPTDFPSVVRKVTNLSKLEELERAREKLRQHQPDEEPANSPSEGRLSKLEALERRREDNDETRRKAEEERLAAVERAEQEAFRKALVLKERLEANEKARKEAEEAKAEEEERVREEYLRRQALAMQRFEEERRMKVYSAPR